ncbi:MAG: hypothetical protein SNJ74_08975 [Fimbriimonadaceae bacterium]
MRSFDGIRRVARGTEGAWQWVSRIPVAVRLRVLEVQDEIARRRAKSEAVPTALERQESLIEFYAQYEALVEVLCDSSQYGPDAAMENRYRRVRTWMQANYPEIRKFVTAYLKFDPADASMAMDPHGQSADAFEALFAAPTLAEFLKIDDGGMIDRIMRTREALRLYGEHLKHLVNRERECV